jgi:4a-hydroxytetrahydrobiopterin dehydratase
MPVEDATPGFHRDLASERSEHPASVPQPLASVSCDPLPERGILTRGAIMNLAGKHCVPCRGGVPPVQGEELELLKAQVPGWQVVDGHHLTKTYTFPDFRTALDFVNKAGAIAEAEGHHPDVLLSWGKVEVKTWTHKIDGLTESDFILAAKLDQVR